MNIASVQNVDCDSTAFDLVLPPEIRPCQTTEKEVSDLPKSVLVANYLTSSPHLKLNIVSKTNWSLLAPNWWRRAEERRKYVERRLLTRGWYSHRSSQKLRWLEAREGTGRIFVVHRWQVNLNTSIAEIWAFQMGPITHNNMTVFSKNGTSNFDNKTT
jgi:hypothetical protein